MSAPASGSTVGLGQFDQATRLLREDWPNATMLAEELFAMFVAAAQDPAFTQPVTMSAPNSPPLNIQMPPGATYPPVTVTQNGVTTPLVPTTPSGGTVGGVPIQSLPVGGDTGSVEAPPTAKSFLPQQVNVGVISGTADKAAGRYTVELQSDPDGTGLVKSATVTATQKPNNPDDEIPAGTYCLVVMQPINSGTAYRYYLLVPVWL